MLKDEIEKKLGGGYVATSITIPKNNGAIKHGYAISKKGSCVGCTIYIDGIPEDEVVDFVVKAFKEHEADTPDENDIKDKILNVDFIRDNVYPVLLNRSKNEDLLESIPHRSFFEFEISYRVDFNNCSTILIPEKLLDHLEIDEQWLYINALNNINDRAEIFKMSDGDAIMLIISNKDKHLGSGSILSEKIKTTLNDVFPDDIFLIPSSVDEWIAIPLVGDYSDMKKFVEKTLVSINKTLPEEQFLSNTIYVLRNGEVEVA